jgi:hypothetical protein
MDGILFRSGGSNSWSEVEAIKESILFDCFAQSCSTNSFVIDDGMWSSLCTKCTSID